MQIYRRAAFTLALALVAASASAQGNNLRPLQGQAQPQQPRRTASEQQDVDALVRAVNGLLTADPIATTLDGAAPAAPAADEAQGAIPVRWASEHFLKRPAGETAALLTLTVDPAAVGSPRAAVYLRVVSAQDAANFLATVAALKAATAKDRAQVKLSGFSAEGFTLTELPADGRFSRALQLKPGRYVAFVAVKARSTSGAAPAGAVSAAKIGLLRHELVVPDFTGPELTTSSMILTNNLIPLTAAPTPEQIENDPYIFGAFTTTPSRDGRFSRTGEVMVIFWIYGATAAAGKPDVTVESQFFAVQAVGERYFNRTAPQELNARTLPATFDLSQGHQLLSTVAVPLASFPAGGFRLEIKITDKPTGKTIARSVSFTVVAD